MRHLPKIRAAGGIRGWRHACILFLIALVPLSPILAQIHDERSNLIAGSTGKGSTQTHVAEPSSTRWLAPILRREAQSTMNNASAFAESGRIPARMGFLFLTGQARPVKTDGCTDGKRDAELENSSTLWFFLGLTLSVYGVLAAYLIRPSPDIPPDRDMPIDYINSYNYCYRDVAKGIHTTWAWIGLGVELVIFAVVYVILMGNAKSFD